MEEDSIIIDGGICDGCDPKTFGFDDCILCPCYKCQKECNLPYNQMCEDGKQYLPRKPE